MKNNLVMALAIVFALLPVGYFCHKEGYLVIPSFPSKIVPSKNNKFPIKACKVLDGHDFEFLIEKDNETMWIRGKLSIKTKSGSKAKVVEFLNKFNGTPVLVLKEEKEDYWVIDLVLGNNTLQNWILEQKMDLRNSNG